MQEVEDGMLLGLGTGSTVAHLLAALGDRVAAGLRVTCVPSSTRTETEASRLGIPLATLEEHPTLDLCIDGADEVDPRLDCLKGLGGAFVREKVVAAASRRFVLIVHESKLVAQLGETAPVLVEVLPFAAASVSYQLRDLAVRPWLKADAPFVSDNGNPVLALPPGLLEDPYALASRLDAAPGVIDHGLFLGMAQAAYVAAPSGVRKLER